MASPVPGIQTTTPQTDSIHCIEVDPFPGGFRFKWGGFESLGELILGVFYETPGFLSKCDAFTKPLIIFHFRGWFHNSLGFILEWSCKPQRFHFTGSYKTYQGFYFGGLL